MQPRERGMAMNARTWKTIGALLALVCLVFAFGCSAPAPSGDSSASALSGGSSAPVQRDEATSGAYLSGTSYAPATEAAINDFIAAYGKDSPDWNGNAYVVCDFDNITAIFDIAEQCNAYQLQTMSFALDPAGLRAALAVGIDEGPVEEMAFVEILFKFPKVGSIGGIISWRTVNHIARSRYIIFNALLGLRSKGSGH